MFWSAQRARLPALKRFGTVLQQLPVEAIAAVPLARPQPIREKATVAPKRVTPGVTPCLLPDEFFNRSRECREVEAILNSDPQISIFLGPPNSGKTTLIRQVLSEMVQSWKRPILHLDLRSASFNTPEGVYRIFAEESPSLLQRIHNVLPDVKSIKAGFDAPFGLGAHFEAALAEKAIETAADKEANSVDKLNAVFKVIDRALPDKTLFGFKTKPVLFIDEANKLNVLLKHKDGHVVLRNLFDWFAENTKQEGRFHVVLGSSASFFHLWVQEYISRDKYKSYVIGDLDQKEARRYWTEKLVPSYDWRGCQPPSFEMVYEVCGGNMMYMKQFALQWVLNQGDLPQDGFALVMGSVERFQRAREPEHFSPLDGIRPVWSEEQLFAVMQLMVKNQDGFLIYDDLRQKFGSTVINSMIEHHLMHLRPSKEFSYDLPSVPRNAIVTPMGQADRYAMKIVLQRCGILPKPEPAKPQEEEIQTITPRP